MRILLISCQQFLEHIYRQNGENWDAGPPLAAVDPVRRCAAYTAFWYHGFEVAHKLILYI